MGQLQVTELVLTGGQSFRPGSLTLVVGPNNSGKSRFLREISENLSDSATKGVIVARLRSNPVTLDKLFAETGVIGKESTTTAGRIKFESAASYFGGASIETTHEQIGSLRNDLGKVGPTEHDLFRNWFGRSLFARLDTRDRLALTDSWKFGNNQGLLNALYDAGPNSEATANKYVQAAFNGLQIKLDYATQGNLCLRVGRDFSQISPDPRLAREPLEAYELLDTQGDGLKSFVATVLTLVFSRRPILLIDEPEALLHPPQAMLAGQMIADFADDDRIIICATHSVDILRGSLSRRPNLNLLRLQREPKPKFTLLNSDQVTAISNHPLLASSRVLDGLFYRGVVIVEGDSDRALYQRIAQREFPGDEVHYVNAHNKQTLYKLIEPYEDTGVRFAAVIDFDGLRRSDELRPLLEAARINNVRELLEAQAVIRAEIENAPVQVFGEKMLEKLREKLKDRRMSEDDGEAQAQLTRLRREVRRLLDEGDAWSDAKKRGYAALSDRAKAAFAFLDRECRKNGIFFVHCGGLESWLEPNVPRVADKAAWISDALLWLSNNELPADSPLKAFVNDIHNHLVING